MDATRIEFEIPETFDEAMDAAIERGAAKVAEVYGADWFRRIDPDTLCMASGRYCLVGQLERDANPHVRDLPYAAGVERLGISGRVYWGDEDDYSKGEDLTTLYGFEIGAVPYGGTVKYIGYDQLQDRWEAKIRALLANGHTEVEVEFEEGTVTHHRADLIVDGEKVRDIRVDIEGRVEVHRKDHGKVRKALRDRLAVIRTAHPDAKSVALSLDLGRDMVIREEWTA